MVNRESPPTTVFIVGATATGKSTVALEIAQKLNGEIVSADSQTIRKHLNIGTAKPTKAERQLVPHHMLDIIEPYERFSVADFQRQAQNVIHDVQTRGKLPIVAGGSGLYIDALFYDYQMKQEDGGAKELEKKSVAELQNSIQESGLQLPKNATNPRHLIGVLRRGEESESDRREPIKNTKIYGLKWSDDILKQRIHERVESMFASGFVNEVRTLINEYGPPPQSLDAIGYPITLRFLNGELSENEAKKLFKQKDWQYARRQKSWFKRNPHIDWINGEEDSVNYIIDDIKQL